MIKNLYLFLLPILFNYNTTFTQTTEQIKYETDEYTISFPRQFEKSSQTIPSSLGQLLMTIISYEPKSTVNDSNYVYMIMETKYPDSSIHSDKTEMVDDFFKASITGAIKNVNGKLISETKGLTSTFPNRTVEIDFQNGLAVIRMTMILKGSKMIIIQTITNTQNYPNLSINNFHKSFTLK